MSRIVERDECRSFTTADILPVLRSMYDMRSELAPLLLGQPGVGKTQQVQQLAREKGVKMVTFILSNALPSEVSGIRMPDNETKKLTVFDDERMASLEDGDILFFDELLEAPPMLWSSILTLVQDRTMSSGRKLPDVFIVAASNPVVSAQSVPASVRDRFQWIDVSFDYKSWEQWFADRYDHIPPAKTEHFLTGNSGQWNILTPRRFCKMWEYYRDDPDNIINIRKMFNADIAYLFEQTIPKKDRIDSRRMVEALLDKGIAVPEVWADLTRKELGKMIHEDPRESEIIAALSSMEVPEGGV